MQTPEDSAPKISSKEESSGFAADSGGTAAVETTKNEKAERKGGGFLAKVKTFFSALLLIAISGGIGYGAGILRGNLQVKQARQEKVAALADVDSQLSEANAKVAAAEARSEYAQVQLRLLEGVDELEQRNFGNANTQLRLASETLSQIEISKSPEQLAELKEELSTAEINFAVNPVEQRKLMLSYSEKIEELLPE